MNSEQLPKFVWPIVNYRDARAGSYYVVTDEPDAVYERATKAGAAVVREMRDEDYGSRGFTVSDPEGNRWSFGTYRGEAPDTSA